MMLPPQLREDQTHCFHFAPSALYGLLGYGSWGVAPGCYISRLWRSTICSICVLGRCPTLLHFAPLALDDLLDLRSGALPQAVTFRAFGARRFARFASWGAKWVVGSICSL